MTNRKIVDNYVDNYVDNLWITFLASLKKPSGRWIARGRARMLPHRGAIESYPQVIHKLSTGYPQFFESTFWPFPGAFLRKKVELSTKKGFPYYY